MLMMPGGWLKGLRKEKNQRKNGPFAVDAVGLDQYIERYYGHETAEFGTAPTDFGVTPAVFATMDAEAARAESFGAAALASNAKSFDGSMAANAAPAPARRKASLKHAVFKADSLSVEPMVSADMELSAAGSAGENCADAFDEFHSEELAERVRHLSDTFSQYLMYLIKLKGLENAEVWRNALVDKKTFSKIKNDENYHPGKLTALCLCMGARLNLDETRDLLARAGYALSPCEKTDIIFAYFIENGIYDMIELDIQLEEHGLPCIIE